MLAARQVLEAIVTRISQANTDAGANVHVGRAWPEDADTLPIVKVIATDEDLTYGEDDITFPRARTHALTADVRCVVRDVDDAEAAAERLALQVLLALEGTQQAASLYPLQSCNVAAQRITRALQSGGEASTAIATVTFEVLFGTASDDPETLI
jgi:hypothetical protein